MHRPLGTAGKVSGTGTFTLSGNLLAGALISADGTNAAVVLVRRDNELGPIIFDLSSKVAGPYFVPGNGIEVGSQTLYYSISGTGASAQFFEYLP